MWSLAQTLERVSPWLPAALVPSPALSRTLDLARGLPAAITDCIYLERWLGGAWPRVDLIVRVPPEARVLLGDGARAGEVLARPPAGPRLQAFARAWSEETGVLHHAVEAMWLEFDEAREEGPGLSPVPRVFVDFRAEAVREASIDARLSLADAALRPLMGEEPPVPLAEAVRACLEAMPAGARVPYIGLGGFQAHAVVRVCVQGLGPRAPRYLRDVGWPGDVDLLEDVVLGPLAAARGGDGPAAVLHLDLRPGVAPRLGLEYTFAREAQARGSLAETALLEHLLSRAWCGRAEVEGLQAWPGEALELLPHQIWPSRVERRVSHVKVTYATGEDLAVKAYLRVVLEPAPNATLLGTRPFVAGAGVPSRSKPGAIE